MYDMM